MESTSGFIQKGQTVDVAKHREISLREKMDLPSLLPGKFKCPKQHRKVQGMFNATIISGADVVSKFRAFMNVQIIHSLNFHQESEFDVSGKYQNVQKNSF